MLLKHRAPRTHAKAAGAIEHRGSDPSREISHIPRENSPEPVVLVVERDSLLRWALFETLAGMGFRVLAAPNSVCAEAWLSQIDQDLSLALLDDDTWPLTPSVRALLQARWPWLPIVVTLSGDDPALEARTRAHGAAEVLVKSFDLGDLVQVVERLTGFPHAGSDTGSSAEAV